MTGDRADRISERRGKSKKKVREAAEEAEKEAEKENDDPDEPEENDENEEDGGKTMKDERHEKMFYLSPEQYKEVDHVYNKLKTDFEYEYDQTFLKNQHYYALVVKYGLDSLENLDAHEIYDLLADLGILEA